MATVKLDMTDPGTKAVVDGWADGTEYTIMTGKGPQRNIATVVASQEEQAEEQAGPTEGETGPPESAQSMGAAAVKSAMGG